MKKNNGFSFKQFHVDHDTCAMKVGTDGILLGAWADLDGQHGGITNILDIGTGTGLISLMLAQRADAEVNITAIDIAADACRQARQNIAQSPWPTTIQVSHTPLQDFSRLYNGNPKFDLIVSNPPYFVHGQSFNDPARQLARHTSTLTHRELLEHALLLLAPQGRIALVLPYDAGRELIVYCRSLDNNAVHCPGLRAVNIKTTPRKAYSRMLLEITREPRPYQESELIIHTPAGEYSEAYVTLTRDFYLNM